MKTKYWVLIFAVILLVCGVSGYLLMAPGQAASQAQIRSEGKIIRTVDLRIDQEFEVDTGSGRNVITVQNGKIAVTEADCPDHYCMNRGFCSGGTEIVCLPNRLVISFLGDQDVDGVVG